MATDRRESTRDARPVRTTSTLYARPGDDPVTRCTFGHGVKRFAHIRPELRLPSPDRSTCTVLPWVDRTAEMLSDRLGHDDLPGAARRVLRYRRANWPRSAPGRLRHPGQMGTIPVNSGRGASGASVRAPAPQLPAPPGSRHSSRSQARSSAAGRPGTMQATGDAAVIQF